MADITIYVSEERYNQLLENGFDPSWGGYIHNIAVMCAPYDTGNLRKAISLAKNTPKLIRIQYNHLQANYIYYLEEGIGPVTKHKDFIKNLTVNTIMEQLTGIILTGVNPTFTSPPVVALRRSQYRPFNAKSSITGVSESDILRQANMYTYGISAQARGQVSKIRETMDRTAMGGKITRSTGIRTEVTALQGQRTRRINKNISSLGKIYQVRKQEYLANREEASKMSSLDLT